MMSCSAADLTSQDALVRLYAHETSRVYCDKLTTDKERDKFQGFQADSMQKYFKVAIFCRCFSDYLGKNKVENKTT